MGGLGKMPQLNSEELRQAAYQEAVELENLLLEWLKVVRHIRVTLEGKEIQAEGGKRQ